jgi:hypothetical protein
VRLAPNGNLLKPVARRYLVLALLLVSCRKLSEELPHCRALNEREKELII